MYRLKMANVIDRWMLEGQEQRIVNIIRQAYDRMMSRTNTEATAKEVADEMQKAIAEIEEEDNKDIVHQIDSELETLERMMQYEFAYAIVKDYRKRCRVA